MPTGYTCDVATGEVTDFRTFAMRCARAFGALVMLRDEPFSSPIPQSFEPNDYHIKALAVAEAELARLKRLTLNEAEHERDEAERQRVISYDERERSRIEQKRRYITMLSQVDSWEPPTPDHYDMKKFMREQLVESIKLDCSPSTYNSEPLPKVEKWLSGRIEAAQWDVEYHRKEYEKEVERTNGRNEWLAALRASLPPYAPTPTAPVNRRNGDG